ncbi:MAG: DUF4252 domain-containing protein [Pyrinomonadaceae bacterium]
MKRFTTSTLKLLCVSLFFTAGTIYAQQDARLEISHLDRLEQKASQVVDVTVDERMLQLAAKFLSAKKPDEARIKELVSGLKGVYVKSFRFDAANGYTDADVSAIRAQLNTPRWSRMVNVRSKREGQNVDVYMMLDGNSVIKGLAVIAAEAKQLTVVNIVGPVDVDKLTQLSGNFGIPSLTLKHDGEGDDKIKRREKQ